ncbi:Probable RNA-directed DNA polymerase from transposon BS [Eumeta japonica]|uniref:Probable RNA-directed DNA polymerase from transposon BS n=1 Tax=Eumeta variegata TaxID=151549 RepID=A0A4C1ZQT0_EUMVA|nr:Probable RNA-directed DNA polymerase from transposon BS [Eumeta japonica]
MGDFNAKVGTPRTNEHLVMKKYGYDERNKNGQRLINLALEHELTIINTCFKKKTKPQVDLAFTRRCKITLTMPKKNRTNYTNKNTSQLKNIDEITKYKENLSSFLSEKSSQPATQENEPVQTAYDNITKAIQQSLTLAKRTTEGNKKHKILQETREEHTKNSEKNRSWIEGLKTLNKDIHIRTDIVSTATEFYKNLYRDKARIFTNKTGTETADYHSIPPIHETEVINSIRKLKLEKSPGADNVTNEALKFAHQILPTPLTELFNSILISSETPKEWSEANIILIYKKGDPKNISNYRPISLLPNMYKLFSSIINNRLSAIIEAKQPIKQAGFKKGYSTIDHIHTIELIIEKYQELQRPLYITFIDYQKAFDPVTHSSPAFQIERGVRQGDPLSPTIFIAILESIMNGLDWSKTGLHIKGAHLNRLRFADDLVLLSETVNEMQSMIESLQKASTKSNPVERTTRQEKEGKTLNPLGRRSQKISWLRLVLHSTGPTELGIFGGGLYSNRDSS